MKKTVKGKKAENVTSWDILIEDTERRIQLLSQRIDALRGAISHFKEMKEQGQPLKTATQS